MRRALVFLLLGPLAVAISVTMALVSPDGIDPRFAELFALAIFLLTVPVSAIIGVIDSYLARRLPAPARAGLIAAAGAIIPCMLLAVLSRGEAPVSILLPFAVCGAASMFLSALLAEGLGLHPLAQGYAAALQARSDG